MRINVKSIVSIIAVQTLLLFCLFTSAHALPIPPAGDAVVADPDTGTNDLGALFIVGLTPGFPTFGQRTLVSDFGNPAQGPLGDDPLGVALDGFLDALVIDERAGTDNRGTLFNVNLRTGQRTILSDFGDPAQGPLGDDPVDVILGGMGNALVIDEQAGTDDNGALYSVDLNNGQRTLISDFGNPAQGPIGDDPAGLTLEGPDNVLVIDIDEGTGNRGLLFRVDLNTGQRIVISDFGNPAQGVIGQEPEGVTLDSLGNALVSERAAGTDNRGSLIRVDLTTGFRTLISDFGNPAQGPLGDLPKDVVLDSLGDALVIDEDAGTDEDGGLFSVDLTTGDRTLISDFGNPAQGPLGVDPEGVAFRPALTARPIPTLSEWGLIALALSLGIAGIVAYQRRRAAA